MAKIGKLQSENSNKKHNKHKKSHKNERYQSDPTFVKEFCYH